MVSPGRGCGNEPRSRGPARRLARPSEAAQAEDRADGANGLPWPRRRGRPRRQRCSSCSGGGEGRLADPERLGGGHGRRTPRALRFSVSAAEKGDAFAQLQLGLRYAKGDGVPQSYVEAHKWVNLAAAEGDSEAAKSRDVFAKLMIRQQVAEAQRLAREWTARQTDKK